MSSSDPLAPELKIFLSVDVINSTQYKNEHKGEQVQPWLRFFHDFFTEFPDEFRGNCRGLKKKWSDYADIAEPESSVWKINGDEILFQATLDHYLQALLFSLRPDVPPQDDDKGIEDGESESEHGKEFIDIIEKRRQE